MMGRKQFLHELLREDQEPFQLKTYIADRRCQLRRPKTTATLHHLKKRKQPINCNHVCLFSFRASPDFPSPSPPPKSPTANHANTVFLQIPARTAALLLDAAMRIQKQSCKSKTAASSGEGKNVGSGLFGSLLKRLSITHRNKRQELAGDGVFVKRSSRPSSSSSPAGVSKSGYEINSRLSSAGWSETNLETSCSSRSRADSEEFVASGREEEEDENAGEKCFCTSSSSTPSSPFRFSLQKSPNSSGHRTPEFSSPASSPTHHCTQETTSYEVEIVEEARVSEGEEKEQFSPVSVLDPPFEDDDDDDDGEGRESEDGYDLECSYANVQRAKQQLLQKLRRFERLAELDPIELEKRMSEGAENEADDEDEECGDYYESIVENTNEEFLIDVFDHLGFVHGSGKVPSHMKRFVSDIIAEEKNDHANEEEGSEVVMIKRVCRRLDSWKFVQSNTIDMMVEMDLRREGKGWTRHDQEHIRQTGIEIEDAIFGFLIEELSEELVS